VFWIKNPDLSHVGSLGIAGCTSRVGCGKDLRRRFSTLFAVDVLIFKLHFGF